MVIGCPWHTSKYRRTDPRLLLHVHYMSQDKRHQPQKSDDKHTMNDMQITDLPAEELLTHAQCPHPKKLLVKIQGKTVAQCQFQLIEIIFRSVQNFKTPVAVG